MYLLKSLLLKLAVNRLYLQHLFGTFWIIKTFLTASLVKQEGMYKNKLQAFQTI